MLLSTSTGLSTKTIRRHVDNLWLLGGELILALHDDPSRRKIDTGRLLHEAIDDDSGPLIYSGSEIEHPDRIQLAAALVSGRFRISRADSSTLSNATS